MESVKTGGDYEFVPPDPVFRRKVPWRHSQMFNGQGGLGVLWKEFCNLQ
jgi:hypothetical protein